MAGKRKTPPVDDEPKPVPKKSRAENVDQVEALESRFPRFVDTDITISFTAGDDSFKLHKAQFVQVNDPKLGLCDLAVEVIHPVKQLADGVATAAPEQNAQHVLTVVLRLLYGESDLFHGIPDLNAKFMFETAIAADKYGVSVAAKDRLVAVLCTSPKLGLDIIPKDDNACLIMQFAEIVQNERIFLEALRHVVGQETRLGDTIELMPLKLITIIRTCVEAQSLQIRNACVELLRAVNIADLPAFVAAGIIYRYMAFKGLTGDTSPTRAYEPFKWLSQRDKVELMEHQPLAHILSAVKVVEDGLYASQDIVQYLDDHVRDDIEEKCVAVDNAQEQRLNIQSVKNHLEMWTRRSKEILKPLLEDDRNYDYFTWIDFRGPFPWDEGFAKGDGKNSS